MATLRIKFQDGKFVSHNGVAIEKFTPNYVKGNGWNCQVNENGDFYCVVREERYGKIHQLKFCSSKGRIKLALRIGDGESQILKTYKLDKWPTNGVIGLPSGFIDNRRPYFRYEEFQDFLDVYSITSVRRELSEGLYQLDKKVCESEIIKEEKIETDGHIDFLQGDVFKCKDENSFIERTNAMVSDATWVVKYTYIKGIRTQKILITWRNPKKIEGLPKD